MNCESSTEAKNLKQNPKTKPKEKKKNCFLAKKSLRSGCGVFSTFPRPASSRFILIHISSRKSKMIPGRDEGEVGGEGEEIRRREGDTEEERVRPGRREGGRERKIERDKEIERGGEIP